MDGVPSKQPSQAGLYKIYSRKVGATPERWVAVSRAAEKGWLRALNQGGPDDPQAPALPIAYDALSSPRDSSTDLGTHPASSGTHAATCAASLCLWFSPWSGGLKQSCACPILKFLGKALFSISIMELKSELQLISDEDEILTSAWYQFIHNYGNQYALNVFTKQWWRLKLTLNIFENLRHFLGHSMFTAYT